MHAGHDKINREEEFGFLRVDRDLLAVVVEGVGELERCAGYVMAFEFFVVLETLDHEKGQAQQDGDNEVADQQFALAHLRAFTAKTTVTELTIRTAVLKAPILMLSCWLAAAKR